VTATKGRLTVRFGKYPGIDDSEHIVEDESTYGVPTSAAQARRLADLYQEAEEILAAYEEGRYVPPPPLGFVFRDHQPRSTGDPYLTAFASMIAHQFENSLFFRKEPLDHRMANLWRRMQGKPEQDAPPRSYTSRSAIADSAWPTLEVDSPYPYDASTSAFGSKGRARRS
jgi:hypothetical protein